MKVNQLRIEARETSFDSLVVGKEERQGHGNSSSSSAFVEWVCWQTLLSEFADITLEELRDKLPLMQDI